jgi:4-hydroxybenzoate polyprenyltransferase
LLVVDSRPGPAGKVTDQELIALAVAQAVTGLVSDRQFLGTIGRLLPGYFPYLPDQSQYNRRLRRLTPWITTV